MPLGLRRKVLERVKLDIPETVIRNKTTLMVLEWSNPVMVEATTALSNMALKAPELSKQVMVKTTTLNNTALEDLELSKEVMVET